LAFPPTIGLLMPDDQNTALTITCPPPLVVNAEVERRAERDFASAIFEPPLVNRDHTQIFREIGRIDYGDALRLGALTGSRSMRSHEHLPETLVESLVRINSVWMKSME